MLLLLYWQFRSLGVLHVLTFSDIVFVRNSLKICYGISGLHIFYWSMFGWSVVGALGRWFTGRWSVVADRLVG